MIQNTMLITLQKTKEYIDYIERHYNNVQKAWKLIQQKCNGKGFAFLYDDFKFFTLDAMIKEHDLSKLSKREFVPYRQTFFPINDKEKLKAKVAFKIAWEHHKKKNTHHWQNWTKNKKVIQELELVHNICDWIAMGMEFGDTAKDYYEKNKKTIKLPKWAIKLMYEIFACIYENVKKEKK